MFTNTMRPSNALLKALDEESLGICNSYQRHIQPGRTLLSFYFYLQL